MSPLRTALLALPMLAALGCPPEDTDKPEDTAVESVDADGDGYPADEDCDDSDPSINPEADEDCDGVDNDCDGETDEIGRMSFYADTDGDGYGDAENTVEDCEPPSGYVADSLDCDDSDPDQHPGADEYCNGEDDDCDDEIDEEGAVDPSTWYLDDDGDGWGDEDSTTEACTLPSGYAEQAGDCDDDDDAQYPGADEYCNGEDDDCDDEIDEDTVDAETWWYADTDGDGYGDAGDVIVECAQPTGYVLDSEDCDDDDAAQHPGADEYCNGEDDDCDGDTDEDHALDGDTFYADTDGDGYGDLGSTTTACAAPSGYTDDATDCDDEDDAQYPGAYEYCNGEDDDCDGDTDEDDAVDADTWYADTDGDGWGDDDNTTAACEQPAGYSSFGADCDDTDASVNLGADELCNSVDDNCDGDIDEDSAIDATDWFADLDGDGYGDATTGTASCDQPTGWVAGGSDCDDSDISINPAADELCNGVDDDCDGYTDEDEAVDVVIWYQDADGDGWGDDKVTDIDCEQPSGWVDIGGDCDDGDAAYNPDATEDDCTDPADYNCDGSTGYLDDDADGWAACEDCDDSDAAQYPGAEESCNGEDDDCDGDIDEGAKDEPSWYADVDGDGYGVADDTRIGCEAPSGYVDNAEDCDDDEATINPGATELCDGSDNDCDGELDEDDAYDATSWYADTDGDGYGDASSTKAACDQPSGYVDPATNPDTDCDDSSPDVHPGADESCNGKDDDCDGDTDEGDAIDVATWYLDYDGDGYGTTAYTAEACGQPSGYVDNAEDCDDADASEHPGADEHCDGTDEDCDGEIDEDAVDGDSWYADNDGDGYGSSAEVVKACSQPSDYVADSSDCDDGDDALYPGADERCDGEDNDCDGDIDEDDAVDVITWYADADGDGHGDPSDTEIGCSAPSGFTDPGYGEDCDDTDATVHPDADELCDGIDNDCDGDTDEDEPVDAGSWYTDADGDGYGDPDSAVVDCTQPSGTIADGGDCDDTDASIYPGAEEYCDGIDTDCDDMPDDEDVLDGSDWYFDGDGDGYGDATDATVGCTQPTDYVADDTDCDDTDAAIHPGAAESCNGTDDDCDGDTDEDDAVDAATWYLDADGDGHGSTTGSTTACDQPSGYASTDTDCDDGDAAVNPDADELCNGADDDCDGTVDDDPVDGDKWYLDADGDGYGDAEGAQTACSQPSGTVADDSDCDDTDASINPDADESCNGTDDDCDGDTDEDDAIDGTSWYLDADGDGHGVSSGTTSACDQPSGYAATDTDCDDTDASVNPDADELCNGSDDDCDGSTDEDDAADAGDWYEDGDGDGFGDASSKTTACVHPTGYVADGTDCDDTDATVLPGAEELCDGADNDCDGDIDEDDATDASTWYADSDADGYGDASSTTQACSQPTGHVSDATDCDDDTVSTNPGAEETCNGADDDCDGDTDEDDATDAVTWYLDADGDDWGVPGSTEVDCDQPSGYAAADTDCDDADATVYPDAPEACDGIDNDCDGDVDESSATDSFAWYADDDGDGYGDPATLDSSCTMPSGYITDGSDCDDTDASVNPDATELCDGVDNDCDGDTDEDDASGASTWYADSDADGYGDPSKTTNACDEPTGYTSDAMDCDDARDDVNPGETELCGDGADNDCDGTDNGCELTGTWSMSSADAALFGETAGDSAGLRVRSAGDVNADGFGDLLIGAPQATITLYTGYWGLTTVDDGRAYLVHGPVTSSMDLSTADLEVYAESSGAMAGFHVDGVGDVNADGYDDILVGAGNESAAGSGYGAAYLILGPATGGWSLASADATIYGERSNQQLGVETSHAGDIDADGHDDFLVSCWDEAGPGGTYAGTSYLFLGPLTGSFTSADATAELYGEADSDSAWLLGAHGDLTGDGNDDVLVSSSSHSGSASKAGRAYIIAGPVTGSLSLASADFFIDGEADDDYSGTLSAGDVNGDGYTDLIDSAYENDRGGSAAGAAFVLLGPITADTDLSTADAVLVGEAADDWAGMEVSADGDVNGDGSADILVSAPLSDRRNTDAGATYLVYGPASGVVDLSTADAVFEGRHSTDLSGWSVQIVQDTNGDDLDEVFIGVPQRDYDGTSSGAAALFLGVGL